MMVDVGDVLWLAWNGTRYRGCQEITVTKVGRKWAYYGSGRFGISDSLVDGGNYCSPGRVYSSEEDYDKDALRSEAWRAFKESAILNYNVPSGVSTDAIREAAKLLGLKLEDC